MIYIHRVVTEFLHFKNPVSSTAFWAKTIYPTAHVAVMYGVLLPCVTYSVSDSRIIALYIFWWLWVYFILIIFDVAWIKNLHVQWQVVAGKTLKNYEMSRWSIQVLIIFLEIYYVSPVPMYVFMYMWEYLGFSVCFLPLCVYKGGEEDMRVWDFGSRNVIYNHLHTCTNCNRIVRKGAYTTLFYWSLINIITR